MVHRVDGPIGAYRGWDDGTDARILAINHELADVTIFQSLYSQQKHLDMGMEFTSPVVIHNAADPRIFHPNGRRPFERHRKTRLISSSWSDNPNKGGPFYAKLEALLDWNRFEYTFVGRTQTTFKRIKTFPAVPSQELASMLRSHDIYLTASRNDPCSNSVIEALQCGLPCLYLQSGGHAELVGEAGFAFSSEEEALSRLDRLVDEYEQRQSRIATTPLADVATSYLAAMEIEDRT
jgi:glycosyltransferase involved in cell wall biosynthesis